MTKKPPTKTVAPKDAYRSRSRSFQPTMAQRAFVAAAAGLGLPTSVICRMLPTGRAGDAPPLSAHGLRNNFKTELREGLRLANALVEARVYQRALSQDERTASSAQALILNTRGGKPPENQMPGAIADPPLAMHRLSREEREVLERLLTKAMEPASAEESETGATAADDDSRRHKRRQRNPPPL